MAGRMRFERTSGPGRLSPLPILLLGFGLTFGPACGGGHAARKGETVATASTCKGQFQKKLQDMTADLQKMGDQNYKVEMSEDAEDGGVIIYARTMPHAVRQYLTASHVDTVPEIRLANYRGYYQIRPRPGVGCDLDYQVRFVAP